VLAAETGYTVEPESSPDDSLPNYVSLTPVEGDPFSGTMQMNDQSQVAKPLQRLFGLNGQERYQTWPERMVRSGLTAPLDALTGQMQVNDPETNMPTGEAIQRSMDVAGLAGGGGIGGAEEGALGSSGGRLIQMANEPKSASPFYSALEHAVTNVPQDKMPADQWLGTISNSKGVKPEEMDWTGFKDYLTEKGKTPVTKSEVQNFIDSNKVGLEEVNKGDLKFNKDHPYAIREVIKAAKQAGDTPGDLELTLANDGDAYRALMKKFPNLEKDEDWASTVSKAVFGGNSIPKGTSKYSQYALPGGENYSEKLLTLPNKPRPIEEFAKDYYQNFIRKGGEPNWEELPQEKKDIFTKNSPKGLNTGNQYRHDHWDEPNVLAFVQKTDRNIEGKKSLHLEAVQSDWHQQGREQGYNSNKSRAEFDRLDREHQNEQKNISNIMTDIRKQNNLPSAEEAITQKLSHEDRAELVNKRSEAYNNDPRYIQSLDNLKRLEEAKNKANPAIQVPDAPFKKSWYDLVLKRMIREAAEKGYDRLSWTRGENNPANPKNLGQTGEKAEKADKGMRYFYNEMIPKALEKIGKEHGVKVKSARMDVSGGRPLNIDEHGPGAMLEYGTAPIHYIDIPQSLKDVALGKGFPLFSKSLPVSFTPVDGDPHKNAATVGDSINDAAAKYGLNPAVLKGIASIESSWDPGSNRNKTTQYKGLFQIGKDEWKQYGSGDIYNAKDNAEAAAKMLKDHADWFANTYGREPSPGDLYMMHQQGRGFFTNHAMTNIGGNPYPGMRGPQTSESFKQGWSDELARRIARYGGADSVSDGSIPHRLTAVEHDPFERSQVVNHSNHVPYGAGASDTPTGFPVNIDKRIPQFNMEVTKADGEPADLHKYLTIHEIAEYKAMKDGETYEKAHHDIATPAEKKAVQADGVDWKKYTHVMDGYLKKTEEEGHTDLPKGLYLKPYHSRSLKKEA
jgi:Transglycosylase SLT domain